MTSGLCQVRQVRFPGSPSFLSSRLPSISQRSQRTQGQSFLREKNESLGKHKGHKGDTDRKKHKRHKKEKSQRKEKLGECLSEFIKLKLTVLIDHCLSCLYTTSAIQGPTSPTQGQAGTVLSTIVTQ